MNTDHIYGAYEGQLYRILEKLQQEIEKIRQEKKELLGMDPVEHCLGRIKAEASMREKCRRKGLPETVDSALEEIHDAIGLRIVCAFVDDIYLMRDALVSLPFIELVEEKDYIRHVKPNGYRSLHLILKVRPDADTDMAEKSAEGAAEPAEKPAAVPARPYYYAEVQIRTISMDTWAALEHHLKYKKDLGGNVALIVSELKRCADELAATDASMQTIRDMIAELQD